MDISVSDIVSEVKICIDEIGLNDAEFLGTQDNEEMDTIIKSKISEALRFVNGNADCSAHMAFISRGTPGISAAQ